MATSANSSERRFYIFGHNVESDYAKVRFVNERDCFPGGDTRGRYAVREPGKSYDRRYGLPGYAEKPRLIIRGRRRNDFYGLGPFTVTDRAKRLMESIDPNGFDFVECDAFTPKGDRLPPYWFVDAKRMVTDFDRSESDFETYRQRFPRDLEQASNPAIMAINRFVPKPELPDDVHSFYLADYSRGFIVDGILADEWQSKKFVGAVFTPLQEPQADEKPDWKWENHPYWYNEPLS